MQALDHQVCATLQGTVRKIPGKCKVGAMGFIHNQRGVVGMGKVCNFLNIGQDAIIGGGGNENSIDLRQVLCDRTH